MGLDADLRPTRTKQPWTGHRPTQTKGPYTDQKPRRTFDPQRTPEWTDDPLRGEGPTRANDHEADRGPRRTKKGPQDTSVSLPWPPNGPRTQADQGPSPGQGKEDFANELPRGIRPVLFFRIGTRRTRNRNNRRAHRRRLTRSLHSTACCAAFAILHRRRVSEY